MLNTPFKYELPLHFSKAKLSCYHFTTLYYSNLPTFLLNYPPFPQINYKVDLKTVKPGKIYLKTAKVYSSAACDACDFWKVYGLGK